MTSSPVASPRNYSEPGLDRTYPNLVDGALVTMFQRALTAGRLASIYEAQEGQ
ncbi:MULTISPECIES: hypothetical protein [Cyanophyceae]|uniref:Uncharacterized protein n=1 Tax=Leptolyngbya subtilissima DQ-A4 TaxID=2933933 RepID=A0ABV0KAD6_9CYAN|nr:hypothetical protein [Nodosilinea sp. FACHB-141]MBD2115239.1 hypothetical protein [Nodosilinea sp. FACHB-141]